MGVLQHLHLRSALVLVLVGIQILGEEGNIIVGDAVLESPLILGGARACL